MSYLWQLEGPGVGPHSGPHLIAILDPVEEPQADGCLTTPVSLRHTRANLKRAKTVVSVGCQGPQKMQDSRAQCGLKFSAQQSQDRTSRHYFQGQIQRSIRGPDRRSRYRLRKLRVMQHKQRAKLKFCAGPTPESASGWITSSIAAIRWFRQNAFCVARFRAIDAFMLPAQPS